MSEPLDPSALREPQGSGQIAIDDEDALYTKLEKLGCRSWKDLRHVLSVIGIDLPADAPASRAMLRAALDHLKSKRQSHKKRKVDYGQAL